MTDGGEAVKNIADHTLERKCDIGNHVTKVIVHQNLAFPFNLNLTIQESGEYHIVINDEGYIVKKITEN